MDLGDLGHLDKELKDPYDFFPKEDPFWNVVPEDAYNLIGLPPINNIGQYEVDTIGPNSFTLSSEQDFSHQELVKQLQTPNSQQAVSAVYQNPQTNSQAYNSAPINSSDFDPDQFLALCTVPQQQNQNIASLDVAQPSYPSTTVYNNQLLLQGQNIVTNTAPVHNVESLESNVAVSSIPHNGQQITTIPAGNLKLEQHSPTGVPDNAFHIGDQYSVNVGTDHTLRSVENFSDPSHRNDLKGTGNIKNLPGNAQNVVDLKLLLSLISANSRTVQQQDVKKTEAPPNTIVPSAFVKNENTKQVLQALGQGVNGNLQKKPVPMQSAALAKESSLQTLLQANAIKKEVHPQPRGGEKVGNKRQYNENTSHEHSKSPEVTKVKLPSPKEKKASATNHPVSNAHNATPKVADAPKQVQQVIIAPQLVYTTSTTATSIPVTVARGTAIQAAPVMPTGTVPILIDSSGIEKPDKIPIKRVRHHSVIPENDIKQKGGGRSNHNEVEKRYRNKINSSLGKLSMLVMGSGAKSTKSNILERAIEKINDLKRINKRLQAENNKLRMSLKHLTLQDIIAMTYNDPLTKKDGKRSRKGSYSSGDSLSDDPACGDGEDVAMFNDTDGNDEDETSSGNSSGSESLDSSGSFGIQDRTKACLSIFLLAFMFFSPLHFLLPKTGSQPNSQHFGSRMLLSVDNSWDISPTQRSFSSLFIHLILALLIYLWILLKGEPGMPALSKQRKYCSRLLAEARIHVIQRKFAPASVKLQQCLLLMGRGPPVSPIDLMFSFLWNICYFLMMQLGIMNVFKAVGWRLLPGKKSSAQNKEEVEFSCSLAANAYCLLHEIAWTDPASRIGRVRRTFLWLKAVNMAEMSTAQCSHQLYVKIYGNAGLDIAFTWVLLRKHVMRYFINQALRRHRLAPLATPTNVGFLFHPSTYRFLSARKLVIRPAKESTGISKESSLTEAVAKHFFLYQVENVLKCLVMKKAATTDWFGAVKMEMSVINQCFPSSSEKKIQPGGNVVFQSFTTWWQSVLYYLHQASISPESSLAEGICALGVLKDGKHLGVRRTVASALRSSVTATLGLRYSESTQAAAEDKMRQVEKCIKDLKQESEGSRNGKEEFTELEKWTMNTVESLKAHDPARTKFEERVEIKRLGPDRPAITSSSPRKFYCVWYTKHDDWMTGCSATNRVYCFPWLLFGGDKKQETWTVTGVNDWKHLSEKLCIIVTCELLLTARLKLWEEKEADIVTEAELNQAEISLDFLQYFNYPELKAKVKSYSMLLRYLSGCNPVEILRDLQYNPWYIDSDKETDDTAKRQLKDNRDAQMLISSGSQILKHSLTPNDRIKSRMKTLEKIAEGRENSTLRRSCRKILSTQNGRST